MFAIKNSWAVSRGAHNLLKQRLSFCDRLVSPWGIFRSRPQSAIPMLFSLPITCFISHCWLITKSQRAMGKAPKWLPYAFVVQHLGWLLFLHFLLTVDLQRVKQGSDSRWVRMGSKRLYFFILFFWTTDELKCTFSLWCVRIYIFLNVFTTSLWLQL